MPVLALALYAGGLGSLKIRAWRGQLVRGALLGVSTFCFLESLSHMPLAQATAMVFASPIILTLLAPHQLGEQVSAREWFAVVAGFVGVVLMLDPAGGEVQWVAMLPLAAALGEALRDVIEALQCGYPRFLLNPLVERLFAAAAEELLGVADDLLVVCEA